jgi:hypothetical protein
MLQDMFVNREVDYANDRTAIVGEHDRAIVDVPDLRLEEASQKIVVQAR